MRLMLAGRALVVVAALLAVATAVPAPARAQGPATVKILLDLGDGSYYWSTVAMPDRSAPNATWQATLTAAGEHGLWVSHSWHPVFGIAVPDTDPGRPDALHRVPQRRSERAIPRPPGGGDRLVRLRGTERGHGPVGPGPRRAGDRSHARGRVRHRLREH